MHEYEIRHLETGKVLETVTADGFTVNEGGTVTFTRREERNRPTACGGPTTVSLIRTIAVTQVSSSTLIVERPAGKPDVIDILKRTPIEQVPFVPGSGVTVAK